MVAGHGKPDSSPEHPDSGRDSPEPPNSLDNREIKSPRHDSYHHNPNPPMPDSMPSIPPPPHDMPPPMPYSDDGRIMQQPFPFSSMLMPQQIDEQIPTDLRVMASKNLCPCETKLEEPKNLACRPQIRDVKGNEDSDSDAEIDLTSHSSKDDDLRESERLANRIATSIFRSDTVLHDLVPNDLSLGAIKSSDRNVNRNNNLSV